MKGDDKMRKFCPNCGTWSFGYDPKAKVYRCYTVGCGFVDLKKKYYDGLSEKPSNPPNPVEKNSSKLEKLLSRK